MGELSQTNISLNLPNAKINVVQAEKEMFCKQERKKNTLRALTGQRNADIKLRKDRKTEIRNNH